MSVTGTLNILWSERPARPRHLILSRAPLGQEFIGLGDYCFLVTPIHETLVTRVPSQVETQRIRPLHFGNWIGW